MLLEVILHTSLITCKAPFGTIAAFLLNFLLHTHHNYLDGVFITVGKACKHVCLKLLC